MKDMEKRVSIIVDASEDKKGLDIRVLDIGKKTVIADYFVLASGNSTSQVKSIADGIEDKMGQAGYYVKNKEGQNEGRWILLDFGDVIAHVFHREDREFYDLENLWAD